MAAARAARPGRLEDVQKVLTAGGLDTRATYRSLIRQDLVMGHRTAGMEGVYAHIASDTRGALMSADERDWRDSLRARFALSLTSPVPVLDALLAPWRAGREPSALPQTPKGDSQNPGNRL